MVKRKTAAILTVFVAILLWIIFTQEIEAVVNWGSFPDDGKAFVERVSRKYGLGNCSLEIPDSLDTSQESIRACFMSSKLSGERLFRGDDPVKDISYLFYTCRGSDFYGEATYVFYRSSSYYQCAARVAPGNARDGQLDLQVIAASPPDPTFLVWITAKLF